MTLLQCQHFQQEPGLTTNTIIVSLLLPIASAIWSSLQLIKTEKIKSELQKKINVHRLQFEKEFEIYKEVWLQLYELRNILILLRPSVDRTDEKKSYEDTIKDRTNKAAEEGNKLFDITEANRPFYAETIFLQLDKINQLVKKEIIDVRYGDKTNIKYWDEGAETIDKYIILTTEISVSIRNRIGNMN